MSYINTYLASNNAGGEAIIAEGNINITGGTISAIGVKTPPVLANGTGSVVTVSGGSITSQGTPKLSIMAIGADALPRLSKCVPETLRQARRREVTEPA